MNMPDMILGTETSFFAGLDLGFHHQEPPVEGAALRAVHTAAGRLDMMWRDDEDWQYLLWTSNDIQMYKRTDCRFFFMVLNRFFKDKKS